MRAARYQAVLAFLKRNERLLSSLFFVAGLVSDLLTVTLLPLSYVVAVFGVYLGIAAAATLAAHAVAEKTGTLAQSVSTIAPLVTHFVLGSVLSGFLILLTQSGSFMISWPFLLLLGGVFVGNEVLRGYRRHFMFQALLLYLGIFAFYTLAVPLVLERLSSTTFALSAALSLGTFIVYLWLVRVVRTDRLQSAVRPLTRATVGMTLGILVAYALGVIPPIPLSLRDAGIYEQVERIDGEYLRTGGIERSWWDLRAPTITLPPGAPAYAYTAIFAPGGLVADIVHVWQWYDQRLGRWVTLGTVGFTVTGGRDEGYRGYSIKSDPRPGRWRVLVQTETGQTVGTMPFQVAGQ